MPRPDKVAAVSEIKDRLAGAQAVFLAEYAGLSVKAQQALRRSLKAQGAEFQVVKMTLARRAADELDLAELDAMLVGPTGLTFADGDAVAAAKVLKDFAAANDVFTIKGGLLGTTLLTPDRIRQLADIEPRDVLLSKLAGLFKAPTAAMAGLLAALPRGAATVLQALLDRKAAEEPAPAAEPSPEPVADSSGDDTGGGEAEPVDAAAETDAGEHDEPVDAAVETDAVADAGVPAEPVDAAAETDAVADAGVPAEPVAAAAVTDAVADADVPAEPVDEAATAEATETDDEATEPDAPSATDAVTETDEAGEPGDGEVETKDEKAAEAEDERAAEAEDERAAEAEEEN